jgi:hypothetical protein
VRSSAWIWLFSSTHSTSALSGGLRYSPTTSRTLSTNSGSVDKLNERVRWGCTPKSAKYRWTVLLLIPVSAAAVRMLQCVPARGREASTVWSSAATRSSS